jgi:drug/metabolite transporter (DMT)-like permease
MSNIVLMFLMLLVMITWGGSWVNAKVLTVYADPATLVFWRFLFTTVTMIPVMLFMKEGFKFRKAGFFSAIIAALILLVYNLCFFMGLQKGYASVGGVLTTTLIPIITYVIHKTINRGGFLRKDILGLIIGAVGAMFILRIWEIDLYALFHSGNIFFLLAACLWGTLTVFSSKVKTILSPMGFNFYMSLFTSIFVLIFLKGNIGDMSGFDSIFWLNLLMISVCATTFGSSVYFICAGKLGSDKAGAFVFLVPVFALLFSVIFLGERVQWSTIVGGAIALMAVYLINIKK